MTADSAVPTPKFVKVAGVVAAAGFGIVSVVAVHLAAENRGLREDACQRTVDARDDGRAVWLYLVNRDPERQHDPDVVEFVAYLDERLPVLECVGDVPIPAPATSAP